jgi:pyruvate dehydrogenase E1 component alpha subunit
VAVSFFGDGATAEGDFHEALNMAAIWNLPIVYVCENNLYGASTNLKLVSKLENLTDKAGSYGMPSAICDGNDVTDVYDCFGKAAERARTGGGPTLVECKTYRIGGHSRSDANAYRDKEEEKRWFAKDPLIVAQGKFKAMGILSDADIARVDEEIVQEIEEATQFAENSPLPAPEECFTHMFA